MPTDRVDEIMGKWREEAEGGRLVDPEALLESHPEHAAELADRFAAQALVDHYYAEADSLPLVTPERIGDYRIVGEIGRGGMGVVYEAVQESMDRRVALKVLYPTIATTVRTMKRFEREARVTGRLHHTNIVTVHAMGRDAGYVYFAMELIRGQPLDKVIEHLGAQERGDPTSEPMQRLTSDLCGRGRYERLALKLAAVADALHVAHAHGVVHRDVKPSNLVLDGDGELKLTDFGLAQLVGADFGVTRTGEILGTPMYMSPEQVRARREDVDQRTDVYSLGATLYEVLTLTPVHDGKDLGSLCTQILTEEPRSLGVVAPDVPRDLATIVTKALQKQRGDRYSTAGEMAADLRAFGEGRPISARRLSVAQRSWRAIKRRPIRASLLTIVVALVGAGTWLKMEADRARAEQARTTYTHLLERAHDAAVMADLWPRDDEGQLSNLHAQEAEGLFGEAIEIDPGRPDAWLGRALIPYRDPKRSLRDLERAAEYGTPSKTCALARAFVGDSSAVTEVAGAGHPQGSESLVDLYLVGWVLQGGSRPGDAMRFLDAAILKAPSRHFVRRRALITRALARQAADDWAGALQDYAVLYELSSNSPTLALRLANAWRRIGKEEVADRFFQEALELTSELAGPAVWSLIAETATRTSHGPWITAAHEAALRQNPDSPYILALAARQAMGEGREEEAVRRIERARELTRGGHRHRAIVLEYREDVLLKRDFRRGAHLGDPERITALRALIEEHPDAFDLHRVLAVRLGPDNPSAALRVAETALELRPNSGAALSSLAHLHMQMGQYKEAADRVRQGLRHSPNDYHLLSSLCELQTRLGDIDGALKSAEDGLSVRAGHPYLLVFKAQALVLLGQPKRALGALETVTPEAYTKHSILPHPLEHYVRGIAKSRLGDLEAALESFRLFGKMDPGCEAPLQQAFVLRYLGRRKEARQALEDAVGRKPHSVNLLIRRAQEALAQGRLDVAGADLASVTTQAPSHPQLSQVQRQHDLVVGEIVPSTPADHLTIAYTTSWFDAKRAYRHLSVALKTETVRANLVDGHLYNAACFAVRASAETEPAPKRAALEKQAMDWLTEYRDRWQRHVQIVGKGNPQKAEQARAAWEGMRHHALIDPDLASLRDLAAFEALFGKAAPRK